MTGGLSRAGAAVRPLHDGAVVMAAGLRAASDRLAAALLVLAIVEATPLGTRKGLDALLDEQWRQAEEIAAIADDVFVSDETRQRLVELKDAAGETGGESRDE